MYKQRGISLVELMVATTIGLILMTGVVQLFLSSRATFTTQQALARVQETGRLAMEFMAQDIRMAGFMGCISRNMTLTNTLKQSDTLPYRFDTAIEGADINNDGSEAPPSGYPSGLDGTDVVIVRGAGGSGANLVQNNNGGQLFVENTGVVPGACGSSASVSGLCEGDIVVISDCAKARAFQITSMTDVGSDRANLVHASSGDPGNADNNWGGNSAPPDERFDEGSQIIQLNTTAYFIGTGGNGGRPGLFRKIGARDPEQLLEGVEDMQLEYGVDTTNNGIPNEYRNAGAVGNWDRVSSVRIQLLVASLDNNVLPEPQSYTFNGNTVNVEDVGDRRLRQVFINTIGIRSRLP